MQDAKRLHCFVGVDIALRIVCESSFAAGWTTIFCFFMNNAILSAVFSADALEFTKNNDCLFLSIVSKAMLIVSLVVVCLICIKKKKKNKRLKRLSLHIG